MTPITQEGTQELMRSREVALILATGGLGLVRAAYSAGKPAYGVGPGNAPAYIEGTADVPKAVADIITGKTFDNGVLCSSENSVVVDEAVAGDVRRAFEEQGGRFLNPREATKLAEVLVTPQRLPNPELVGKSAIEIAARVGIEVTDEQDALAAFQRLAQQRQALAVSSEHAAEITEVGDGRERLRVLAAPCPAC